MANTVSSGAKLDVECVQGATFYLNLEWQASNGTPLDLTGYTARMQVRESHDAATILIELTTENGRISLNTPSTGGIELRISADDAEGITWTSGVYDLELVHDSGGEDIVDNILFGNVAVRRNVTR